MLARLAPLPAPHHDETIVDGPGARRRNHRRRTVLVVVQLLLLALGSGGAVVVLTGAGSRGVAPGLLGAATAVGVAEVLRRRLGRDAGPARAGRHVAVEASAPPRSPDAGSGDPAEVAASFTGVWSARGAIRRDPRRGPPTRCALPPARDAGTVAAAGRAAGGARQDTAGAVAEESSSPPLDDLDLTREVLAALHAGPGDG